MCQIADMAAQRLLARNAVYEAGRLAQACNITTAALLEYDGGEVVRRGLADFAVVVRSDYIPRIQEVPASVYHVVRELMEIGSHA